MARNGTGKATRKATEPNDLYDELSPEAQQVWDNVGTFGYVPEKGFKGLWFARKRGEPASDAIGPADSLETLHTMVKEYVQANAPDQDEDEFRLENPVEEPIIPELDKQADRCIDAKAKKEMANVVMNDEYDAMLKEMKDHGRKRYSRKGMTLVIEDHEKLTIKPQKKDSSESSKAHNQAR